MIITPLVDALLSTSKPVCINAAKELQLLDDKSKRYNLHLRSANLDKNDIKLILQAIRLVHESNGPSLHSFSMSYNSNFDDEGIYTLVQTLPSALTEIGLVQCGFGDQGGKALLKWAANASKLHWLCIEGNSLSPELRNDFIALGEKRASLQVIV